MQAAPPTPSERALRCGMSGSEEREHLAATEKIRREFEQQLQNDPQDAGLTQAEYERVVKGVKLSDPVDAGVSTETNNSIRSLCRSKDPSTNWVLGSFERSQRVDRQNRVHELTKYEDKPVCAVLSTADTTVECVKFGSVYFYRGGILVHRTRHKFSGRCFNRFGEFETDTHRLLAAAGRFVYFATAEGIDKRGRIVQVNLDTFQERVLDNLKENIADFLVDENQTITYLTSGGELIQENVENNSIPRTSVNLKTDTTTGGEYSALCRVSTDLFVCSNYTGGKDTPTKSNWLQLTNRQRVLHSLTFDTTTTHLDKSAAVLQLCAFVTRGVSFVVCRQMFRFVRCVGVHNGRLVLAHTADLTNRDYCAVFCLFGEGEDLYVGADGQNGKLLKCSLVVN